MILNQELEILKYIAHKTKISYETMSESYALFRRDLLFSANYNKIVIPIFNDKSIKDVINNINLCFYLKSKYNTQILLVLDSRSKLNSLYNLFNHIIDEILTCRRYFNLHEMCNQENVTKLIYNDSLHLFNDADYYTETKPLFADIEYIINNSTNEYPSYTNIISIKHHKYFAKYATTLLSNIKNIELDKIGYLEKNTDLLQNLFAIIHSNRFINMANDDIVDYLVPFLGTKIVAIDTGLYKNKLFKFSVAHKRKLIQNI